MVALIGLWISSRLKAQDRKFEAAAYHAEHRLNTPHMELKLDCEFHGIRSSCHLATFTVTATNVGQVLHKFDRIMLRVRGIKDEPFEYRVDKNRDDKYRVDFPHPLLETNLVPVPKWNFVFVEPGVTQRLALTTRIPVTSPTSWST